MSSKTEPSSELSSSTIDPCQHMENWVNGLADDSLHGPAKLYTQWHVAICPKCNAALKGLRQVREQVQTLRDEQPEGASTTLTDDRRAAVDSAIQSTGSTNPSAGGSAH